VQPLTIWKPYQPAIHHCQAVQTQAVYICRHDRLLKFIFDCFSTLMQEQVQVLLARSDNAGEDDLLRARGARSIAVALAMADTATRDQDGLSTAKQQQCSSGGVWSGENRLMVQNLPSLEGQQQLRWRQGGHILDSCFDW
jgi:hypothetical protein